MNVKQVIVVRNDLRQKLRHGKLAAQVAHASMGAAFVGSYEDLRRKVIPLTPELEQWFNEQFTKVVLRCDDEAELLQIYDNALAARIRACLITDAGHTVFNEPTRTCIGIGPATAEQLEPITGHLKMY